MVSLLLDPIKLTVLTTRVFRLHLTISESVTGTLGDSYPTEVLFLKRFYLFVFRERGRKGERKGEKHEGVVASHAPHPAGNPGRCPNWESNLRHFASQPGAQSTEPHQLGLQLKF